MNYFNGYKSNILILKLPCITHSNLLIQSIMKKFHPNVSSDSLQRRGVNVRNSLSQIYINLCSAALYLQMTQTSTNTATFTVYVLIVSQLFRYTSVSWSYLRC